MSKKKKKKLKQLIRAQMQASQQAIAQGKEIPILKQSSPELETKVDLTTNQTAFADTSDKEAPAPSPIIPTSPLVAEKNKEFIIIKKDIKFAIILMSIILVFFALIYVFDLKYQFLPLTADWIFQFIQ